MRVLCNTFPFVGDASAFIFTYGAHFSAIKVNELLMMVFFMWN